MKTTEEKNRAATEYFENCLLKSWTFYRMTTEEQNRLKKWFYGILNGQDYRRLTGTAEQRKRQMLLLYTTYLQGLGYDGPFWRETAEDTPQF